MARIRTLLSSDTHITETPTLYRDRFPKSLVDSAPFVQERDGWEQWIVDGKEAIRVAFPARAGDRFESTTPRRQRTHWTDVREMAYEPAAWLSAMESEGIYGGVILPTLGFLLYELIEDSEILSAACRAYSDFALEFASEAPTRIKPIAMINIDDVPEAVAEIRRVAAAGAAGLMLPTIPPEKLPYSAPEYGPMWHAIEDAGIPINFHIASNRNVDPEYSQTKNAGVERLVNESDAGIRATIMAMIFSGVFLRHPDLKVVSVEHEGAWAIHVLQAMDWHWKNNLRFQDSGRKFATDLLPSDFFRRNVYISFTEDRGLVRNREFIGVDNLMWGSDFPHAESTYPHSQKVLADLLVGVNDEEWDKMTFSTCAELYGIASPPAGWLK